MNNLTHQTSPIIQPDLKRPNLPAPPKVEVVAVDEKIWARYRWPRGIGSKLIEKGSIFFNSKTASEALGFDRRRDRVRQKIWKERQRLRGLGQDSDGADVIVTLRGVSLHYEPKYLEMFRRQRDAYDNEERAYWREFLRVNGYLNGEEKKEGWFNFLLRNGYGLPPKKEGN